MLKHTVPHIRIGQYPNILRSYSFTNSTQYQHIHVQEAIRHSLINWWAHER